MAAPYLKQTTTGRIYHHNAMLAKRDDMEPCHTLDNRQSFDIDSESPKADVEVSDAGEASDVSIEGEKKPRRGRRPKTEE